MHHHHACLQARTILIRDKLQIIITPDNKQLLDEVEHDIMKSKPRSMLSAEAEG